MNLLISEATEARILQLTEQARKDNPDLDALCDQIDEDLTHAERIEGDIYVY